MAQAALDSEDYSTLRLLELLKDSPVSTTCPPTEISMVMAESLLSSLPTALFHDMLM